MVVTAYEDHATGLLEQEALGGGGGHRPGTRGRRGQGSAGVAAAWVHVDGAAADGGVGELVRDRDDVSVLIHPDDLAGLIAYDRPRFGGDRSPLLEELLHAFTDWRDGVDRLRRTSVGHDLEPLVDALPEVQESVVVAHRYARKTALPIERLRESRDGPERSAQVVRHGVAERLELREPEWPHGNLDVPAGEDQVPPRGEPADGSEGPQRQAQGQAPVGAHPGSGSVAPGVDRAGLRRLLRL